MMQDTETIKTKGLQCRRAHQRGDGRRVRRAQHVRVLCDVALPAQRAGRAVHVALHVRQQHRVRAAAHLRPNTCLGAAHVALHVRQQHRVRAPAHLRPHTCLGAVHVALHMRQQHRVRAQAHLRPHTCLGAVHVALYVRQQHRVRAPAHLRPHTCLGAVNWPDTLRLETAGRATQVGLHVRQHRMRAQAHLQPHPLRVYGCHRLTAHFLLINPYDDKADGNIQQWGCGQVDESKAGLSLGVHQAS